MKIIPQRMTELMNQLIIDKGVCRTAPATPGLLIRQVCAVLWVYVLYTKFCSIFFNIEVAHGSGFCQLFKFLST